ncbi:hypothetical protein ZWY2020_045643 [Hordeum vulgare]|nr:hypothetical protein ZWY2020_045643 [Hordeum vulgare]
MANVLPPLGRCRRPRAGGHTSGTGSSRKTELRRIFKQFDRDNDGKISCVDLSVFFASMGDVLTAPSSSSEGGYLLDLRSAFEVFNAVDQPGGRITARGLRRVQAQLGDDRHVMTTVVFL